MTGSATEILGHSRKLADSKRMVVKIGSVILVDEETGTIRQDWLDALAADVAACRKAGQEVLLVSSGAIAVGRRHLDITRRNLKLEESQAAAATGQGRLIHAYQEAMARHGLTTAQILLTLDDTERRRRHLNARETLGTLLDLGAVPLINENDTVATEEIRFGDNDRLAARVAQMVGADTLVLLSDVDGLYTADPLSDPDAVLVPEVREITPDISAMAGEAKPGDGTGGMVTKLMAARITFAAGCRMVIAPGKSLNALAAIDDGGRASCTWFLPSSEPKTAHKRWIAGALSPAGTITIDAGAAKALTKGGSLLPAGVVAVDGDFERGDTVLVHGPDGSEIGRGLICYSGEDARRVMGHKSDETEAILGYRGREEMIHRDDLVLG
jgi:glutamate 5-kinase